MPLRRIRRFEVHEILKIRQIFRPSRKVKSFERVGVPAAAIPAVVVFTVAAADLHDIRAGEFRCCTTVVQFLARPCQRMDQYLLPLLVHAAAASACSVALASNLTFY